MTVPAKYSVVLTHYGRRSGKTYNLKVWFVEIDDHVWVGTQDSARNWARNVAITGRAALDFGAGPEEYVAREVTDDAEHERFRAAIRAKHPILSRLIEWSARGKTPTCFELSAASASEDR